MFFICNAIKGIRKWEKKWRITENTVFGGSGHQLSHKTKAHSEIARKRIHYKLLATTWEKCFNNRDRGRSNKKKINSLNWRICSFCGPKVTNNIQWNFSFSWHSFLSWQPLCNRVFFVLFEMSSIVAIQPKNLAICMKCSKCGIRYETVTKRYKM